MDHCLTSTLAMIIFENLYTIDVQRIFIYQKASDLSLLRIESSLYKMKKLSNIIVVLKDVLLTKTLLS